MYSGASLFLFAPDALHDELGGICGAYNGDMIDDLTTRPGTVTTDEDEHVNSWDVSKILFTLPRIEQHCVKMFMNAREVKFGDD